MKLAIVILAVVGMTMACDSNNKKTRDEFEAFRRQYRKNYQSTAEEDYRCSVFAENYMKVEEHNQRQARGLETYTVAINKFSDYTHEEFIRMFTGFKPELEQKTRVDLTAKTVREYNPNIKAPASINWDEKGFVTPVKNQGRCGSCYSFASNAVAESRHLISLNMPYAWKDLSEQQVVECSTAYGNQKCNGGLMTNTFRYWIQENHGCNVEDHYPYVSAEGSNGTECKYAHDKSAFRVTGFTELARDDKVLEQAVAEGPVAVGVNADTWANYESGIFCPKNVLGLLSGCSMLGLNHAVVVVGYTADYWIIKNSWGPMWGEGGFIRLCRKFTNNCGINMMCSYPHV